MASITVRNLEDGLKRRLRIRGAESALFGTYSGSAKTSWHPWPGCGPSWLGTRPYMAQRSRSCQVGSFGQ